MNKNEQVVQFNADKYNISQWLSSLYMRGRTPHGYIAEIKGVKVGYEIKIPSDAEFVSILYVPGSEPNQNEKGLITMLPCTVVYMTAVKDGCISKRAYTCAKIEDIKNAIKTEPSTPTGWRLRYFLEKEEGKIDWTVDPVYWGEASTEGLQVATQHQVGVGGKKTLLDFAWGLYPETLGHVEFQGSGDSIPETPEDLYWHINHLGSET